MTLILYNLLSSSKKRKNSGRKDIVGGRLKHYIKWWNRPTLRNKWWSRKPLRRAAKATPTIWVTNSYLLWVSSSVLSLKASPKKISNPFLLSISLTTSKPRAAPYVTNISGQGRKPRKWAVTMNTTSIVSTRGLNRRKTALFASRRLS